MSSRSSVQYLKRVEINTSKWDRCIQIAPNGLIYGYSAYLDAMAGDWDAIVINDYEAVMPLPWRKKWGICYIYQPFLCAQLGLFGISLGADLLADCLNAIPPNFRLWEFSLNHKNLFSVPEYHIYSRVNYLLNLHKPYEELLANYRETTRRNIRRSNNAGCLTKTAISIDDIFAILKEQLPHTNDSNLDNFRSVYNLLEEQGAATTYGILSAKGDLLASAVFLFSHKRAYYILVGNHPNGRTIGASHALIDAFIKDHSGKDILLDFEGSDIRNLAFFYSSFGAVEENYAAIKMNNLPWYVKLLKK